LTLIGKIIISNWVYLLYANLIFYNYVNTGYISFLLPILVIGWALVETNIPRTWFWRFIFLYMGFIIGAKYTMQ